MPESPDFFELTPEDPAHPFGNPTEEPDYSPDYREIVPELSMTGACLPLIPTLAEKHAIRRYISLTCLTLLFAFLTAASVHTALTLLCRAVLQMRDAHAGTLPQNYSEIASAYINDSSVSSAITLISFLCGNLAAFFAGCSLTRLRKADLFRTRELSFGRMLCYLGAGLWIRLVTGSLGTWLTAFLTRAGVPVHETSVRPGQPGMKLAMIALYTVLAAPVTEELLMRGFALKNLSRVSQRFGILLTALLFGLMHENLPQMVFTVPLGILLAYITIRHNSLTPAIITHIAVNSAAMMLEYGRTMLPHSTFRNAHMLYTLVVLLLGTVSLFYMLLTERIPDLTPHQSARSKRLVMTAPLFWVLVAVHLGMTFAAAYLM